MSIAPLVGRALPPGLILDVQRPIRALRETGTSLCQASAARPLDQARLGARSHPRGVDAALVGPPIPSA